MLGRPVHLALKGGVFSVAGIPTVWFTAEHQDDFALHVDVGVVVMLLVGIGDPVADEYEIAVDVALGGEAERSEIVVQGSTRKALKATVERRYKDSNDNWKSSGSYSRNEIPLVIYCLQKAYAAMIDDQQQRADNDVIEEVIE